jgi:uncharacterized protein YjbJ (UPF0337 family)
MWVNLGFPPLGLSASSQCGRPVLTKIKVDQDHVAGAAKTEKDKIKQTVGKSQGDAKMVADGQSDQVAGQAQTAMGGIKDALRGK